MNGTIQMCVTGMIYAEYEEVIRRPRLKRDEVTVVEALRAIRESSLWAKPAASPNVCIDPDDDMFLACAQAARADYLITGNLRHLPPSWLGRKS